MKSNLKHIFMKSFMIAAGLTAGILTVSIVAITVSPWTAPNTNWATGNNLTATDLNTIGSNLNSLKTAVESMNNLATTSLTSCANGQVPISSGADTWACGNPPASPRVLSFFSNIVSTAGTNFICNNGIISTTELDCSITMPTPGVIKNIYISVKNTGIYSGGVAVYIRKNADLGSDQITAINNPSIATSSTGSSSNLTANLAFVAGDKLSIRMDTSFPNGPTTVQISTLTFDY